MTRLPLPENFFRHEYARLVSVLSCRVGFANVEAVEDAVQASLLTALESWTKEGMPEHPDRWLYRAARNRLYDELRARTRRGDILDRHRPDLMEIESDEPEGYFEGEIPDELLRTLFICCDERIARESQIVLALKILCGFDVEEIAHRLFTSQANVYKRLSRARAKLRELEISVEEMPREDLVTRLSSVHAVLYLLFTEGYLSTHADHAIRRELCEESTRLASILAHHPLGRTPTTCALLALMFLHAARIPAREAPAGGLLLLDEQNRAEWDRDAIQVGLAWLAKSAEGAEFSRYHAEAGVAAEHCMAPSFAETRWDRVVECYEILENRAPSPLHRLNRAVAMAEWKGPELALAVLEEEAAPAWLELSYQWSAVLSDLHRRAGNEEQAARHRDAALGSAPNAATRSLLERRLSEQ